MPSPVARTPMVRQSEPACKPLPDPHKTHDQHAIRARRQRCDSRSQDPTMGRYSVVFLDSNIIITGTVQIGLDWKPVGIAPMSGATAFPGLAMRQDRTGALLFFDV